MGTCNFGVTNAKTIYAILSTYETEDENGEVVEMYKDEFDWDCDIEDIQLRGEEKGFPFTSDKWNKELDGREVCCGEGKTEMYGKKGTAWTTETTIESIIVMRYGYYEHANLDYEIKLTDCHGAEYVLSYYNGDVDSLVNDYVSDMEDNIKWDGHTHGWNIGTFYMHRKNIIKWLTDLINNEVDKCENLCKECCDTKFGVLARFSNGETCYKKIG